MRILLLLMGLGLPLRAVAAEPVVLRPDAGDPGAVAARAASDRIARFLEFGGLTARSVSSTELADLSPQCAAVLVVAAGPLSDAETASVGKYVAAGGKLLLFPGAAALAPMVGITIGPPVAGPFEAMQFGESDALTAPGLPVQVPQELSSARELTASPGTLVLGRWIGGRRDGPPAMALSAHGAYLNGDFVLGEPLEKGWLLHAVIAALDPETRGESLSIFHRLALEALQATTRHWAQVRTHPGLGPETVEAIDRDLTRLRLRASAAPGTAATAAERAAALRRMQASISDCQTLRFRMVSSPPVEMRAVWIHTYAPTDWESVMAKLERHHFNSIIVRVGRGGNVIYPSALLPRDEWAERAGGDELKRAIEAAHRHHLAFYAWRVNFHMGSAPRPYSEKMAAEDRLVRGPDGKQAHWANPGDPRNTELEFQAMVEMARNYDVDGIQFDYIRYPDEPHFDFDYGPVSRREFEKAIGRAVADWPRDVLSGPLKIRYEAWERDNISHLVERVSREVRRIRPGVKLSAAVWRSHRYWRPILKQDWPHWVEQGWLDFVVPMDYTTEPETLSETVETQVAASGGRAPIMAGIGNYLLFTPEEVVGQVESARAAGAAGFVLFAYNAEQNDEHLRALAAGATSQPAALSSRGPSGRLALAGTVSRRDAPPALLTGAAQTVRLEEWGGETANARGELLIETPGGQQILDLGPVTAGGGTARRWSFKAPAGRWRPALRGTWQPGGGTAEPFLIFGPVAEGVSVGELSELRRRLSPVSPPTAGRHVAVYAYGLGADRLRDALQGLPDRSAYLIYGLTPEYLRGADVLVLPHLTDILDLDEATVQGLRDWVAAGGAIVLTHDAVGARWHPRLFPEVGEGGTPARSPALELTAPLPPMPAGSRVPLAYSEQIPLLPAPGAEILARQLPPGQAPIILRGKHGRGTVILMGSLPGGGGNEMTEEECTLLRALIESAAGSGGGNGKKPQINTDEHR